MQVSVVAVRRTKPHFTIYPLQAFQKQLKQIGIHVAIHHDPAGDAVTRCDVLCIVASNLRMHLATQNHSADSALTDLLDSYRRKVKRIIWVDDTDSCGEINLVALSKVDVYAKGQLLKDRDLYTQPQYQGIFFKDYYHRLCNITEKGGKYTKPVPADELYKLHLSWNLGLIDWNTLGRDRLRRALAMYWPLASYQIRPVTTSLTKRSLAVSYRVSHRNQAIVDYQRNTVRDILARLAKVYPIHYNGSITHRAFSQEIRNAIMMPSPFGWGEICYRDFEAFQVGAVLLKPSMDHMETWPDYFQPDVTYLPFAWDFSDFESKVRDVLDHPGVYQNIATTGQERFMESISLAGGVAFAQHFAALLQKAV